MDIFYLLAQTAGEMASKSSNAQIETWQFKDYVSLWGGIVGLIGGLCGFVVFGWKLIGYVDSARKFIKIKLEVDNDSERRSILVEVSNESTFRRTIRWAFLLVTPADGDFSEFVPQFAEMIENEELDEDVKAFDDDDKPFYLKLREELKQKEIKNTNDYIRLFTNKKRISENKNAMLVPLTFFYVEQVGIRDENLTFRWPVPNQLPSGDYNVRLFVFPKSKQHGYHRCTHDLLQNTDTRNGEGPAKVAKGDAK